MKTPKLARNMLAVSLDTTTGKYDIETSTSENISEVQPIKLRPSEELSTKQPIAPTLPAMFTLQHGETAQAVLVAMANRLGNCDEAADLAAIVEMLDKALADQFELPHVQDAESKNIESSNQLRQEILSMVRRYGRESDVTVYQSIGVLEMVKVDLIEMLSDCTK